MGRGGVMLSLSLIFLGALITPQVALADRGGEEATS